MSIEYPVGNTRCKPNNMSISVECIASDFNVTRPGNGGLQTDATSALFRKQTKARECL